MGKETNISWCHHTWNPWWGCTACSPGCDNCYAEVLDKRWGGDHWGKNIPRREFGDKHWNEPLKWNRDAETKELVFCASMADVMDSEAPKGARERLWDLIDNTPNLIWQLLTKRPHAYPFYLPKSFKHNNVWLGCSAEDQYYYDLRWPQLKKAADKVGLETTFVSYEPALGSITMKNFTDKPSQIIFGGESGNNRRPLEIKWAEDIKAECEEFGVKFFMKQVSARTPEQGKKLIPEHLNVQQFPIIQ